MPQENIVVFFNYIKRLLIRPNTVKVGDIGIYQDVLSINTLNDDTHSLNYDIYAKVRALGIYKNLIEIEIIDVTILNACNEDVETLIDTNMPKYIKPKYVKWELK